jgi:hypothetical protein
MHEASIESLAFRFRASRPLATIGMGYATRAVAPMIGYARANGAARAHRLRT